MFCFHCGRQLPDGAQFCPDCGAKQPQKPAEKKGKPWRIVLIAVLAAAIVIAAVFGIVKLIDADPAPRDAAVSGDEDEEEEDKATLEQVLLAQSVHVAQMTGQCAGSEAYLAATDTPEEVFGYAQSFSLFAGQPKRVLWCSASEFLAAYPDTLDGDVPEQFLIHSLAAVLNGRFAGNAMLAAASIVSCAETAKLPEALDEPMLFLMQYDADEGAGPAAFVLAAPSAGKLTGFSCTPIGSDVLESAGLDKLACWKTAERDAIEEAVRAAQDVSLRAMAAPNMTADAAWYGQQATAVLERFASLDPAAVPSQVALFTSDPAVVEMASAYVRAAASGAVPDVVYPVDTETLLAGVELSAEEAAALAEPGLSGLIARRMAAAVPTGIVNAYGSVAAAASAVAVQLAALSEAPSAAVALPEDFVPQAVVFALPGGYCAVVTLYDAGNNILGTAVGFAPNGDAAEELAQTLA